MTDEILGAFDIGSGAAKLTVARVRLGVVQEILYSHQITVLVAHAVQQTSDHSIDPNTAEKLKNAIKEMIVEATNIATPSRYAAVATAVFRESSNGQQVLDEISRDLGFPIVIISQKIEGYLGYLTALQANIKKNENIVSWDSGGASFQLVSMNGCINSIENMNLFEGDQGASKITKLMVNIQGNDFNDIQTVNPATHEDCVATHKAIMECLSRLDKPEWLLKHTGRIIGIGGKSCAMKMVFLLSQKSIFSLDDVWNSISLVEGKQDDNLLEYPEKEMLLPKLLLIASVMEYFNFQQVEYFPSNGSTLGMFMYDILWK